MLTFFCNQQNFIITALQQKKFKQLLNPFHTEDILEIEFPLPKPASEFLVEFISRLLLLYFNH